MIIFFGPFESHLVIYVVWYRLWIRLLLINATQMAQGDWWPPKEYTLLMYIYIHLSPICKYLCLTIGEKKMCTSIYYADIFEKMQKIVVFALITEWRKKTYIKGDTQNSEYCLGVSHLAAMNLHTIEVYCPEIVVRMVYFFLF